MTDTRPILAIGLDAPIALRGGVNVIVETLIEGLAPHYRMVLISNDPEGDVPDYLRPMLHGHLSWPPVKSSVRGARELARRAQELGVQIVHIHGGTFGWGMRFFGHCPVRHLARLGIKVIWTNHTWVSIFDGICGPQKPLWLKLAFLPFAWLSRVWEIGALEMLITSSQLTLRMERCYYFPRRDKFRVVYYSRLREDTPLPVAPREKTVLAVGHVAWRKGQLVLARAFAQIAPHHPEWRLVIIGPVNEVEYGQQIEEVLQAPALQGRGQMLGGRHDAIEFIKRAGIFVQPSMWEGLPFALQEALFLGCPSVATRCYGNIELIEHERNGLMVEPDDPEAMAAALDRLIRDESLRQSLAAEGRPFILEHQMTIERMLAQHCEIYDTVLGLRTK